MLTTLQKATAQAIVNIFETGSVAGDYANITLIPGDPGHLTYGRSQTTLASGNLAKLILAYCQAPGAILAASLRPYLPRLQAKDLSLDGDAAFRDLLRRAGADPAMADAQDAFFDQVYWDPAVAAASAIGATYALSLAVVYDSFVHGSWAVLRDRTNAAHGPMSRLGECEWIGAYVDARRDWLATHPNAVLHKTVYRMDAFRELIDANNWALALPLRVRGLVISPATLAPPTRELDDEEPAEIDTPADTAPHAPSKPSTPAATPRVLMRKTPPLRGDDVKALQRALTKHGCPVPADGEFGPKTDTAVRAFQRKARLTADGVVGAATRKALGLP